MSNGRRIFLKSISRLAAILVCTLFVSQALAQPVISSFSPDTAFTGTQIVITGQNLSTTTGVTFGGIAADSFKILSSTMITASVGAGSTGSIQVTTPSGAATISGFVFVPPPVLKSTIPSSAGVGNQILLIGSNFIGVKEVVVGNVPVLSYKVQDSTGITAIVAPGATSGYFLIRTTTGQDSVNAFQLWQKPVISSISPSSGEVATSAIITGDHFAGLLSQNTSVAFGAVQGKITSISDKAIVVTVPPGATNMPVSVTSNTLVGYGSTPFFTTFPGAGSILMPNSFVAGTPVVTTGTPVDVAISDFDGDGKPDLACPNAQGTISIFENSSSTGSFGFQPVITLPVSGVPISPTAGDLDGDGKPDLIVGNVTAQVVVAYRNSSSSTAISFDPPQNVSLFTTGKIISTAITDIDGDGKPDVIVLSDRLPSLTIYRNVTFAGFFAFETGKVYSLPTLPIPSTLAIRDLDQDGLPDIVVGSGANVFIFRNSSTPAFISLDPAIVLPVDLPITGMGIGDFDGDSKNDIVTAGFSPSDPAGSGLSVLKNNSSLGNIQFAGTAFSPLGGAVTNLKVADLDGDGKPDISVLNTTSNTISILKNISQATISFVTKADYVTNASPVASALGDLDGDGKPDLAIMTALPNDLIVWRNRIGEATVIATGANPVTGDVTSSQTLDATVQTYNGLAFVPRHYDISTSTDPASATATITLYYTQTDFDMFNVYPGHGLDLPKNPSDIVGIAALRIFQFHGSSATGGPGTYDGGMVVIDPDDTNIIWNADAQWWQVKFDITGFSGFFAGTLSGNPLPLTLLKFTGELNTGYPLLKWETSDEINVRNFEVQRSSDGISFATISSVPATGGSSVNSYQYTDNNIPIPPVSYYRLRMIDADGKYTLSQVVLLRLVSNLPLKLFPNPARESITINHPVDGQGILEVFDLNGRLVISGNTSVNSPTTTLDIKNLSPGAYRITWSNGTKSYGQTFLVK